jgi:radical SAM superfamily enzyme YgiQ (UPF0313 family)
MKIYLADLFHDYKPNHICVPLGIGFVGQFLRQEFGNDVTLELFKSPAELTERIKLAPPDVLGLANYSWNAGLNELVINIAKQQNSDTVVIQGGPHIRVDDQGIGSYLAEHPKVDFYAMYEGEFGARNLIEQLLATPDAKALRSAGTPIPGIAYHSDGNLIYKSLTTSKSDIERIPSPYLSGLLDKFLANPLYLPLLETNRGCPFACTFCAWGISALDKVKRFSTERVLAEIEYVKDRSESGMWYFTDANFGMFERDLEIAQAIRKAVRSSDHFSKLSVNWAKNSSRYCTEIAHILKGICEPLIAIQTTDQSVLSKVKRSNIKLSTMTDMIEQGRKDGVPMTTDVLVGLPGEDLNSHLNTLRKVFDLGFWSFNVGQIRMLPGSEMETEDSRREFGLETKFRYIAGFMGRYADTNVFEYEESVIQTSTLSAEDMYHIRTVHLLVWILWNSGLGQPLLRYIQANDKINPLDALLNVFDCDDTPELAEFFAAYRKEAREEWFESLDDLEAHFRQVYQGGNFEYLKLNLKYLAKLLLNRPLAECLLRKLGAVSRGELVGEFIDFSLERAIFIEQIVDRKSLDMSRAFCEAFGRLYPSVAFAATRCEFSIDPKERRSREKDLALFDYHVDPLRALTLSLQRFGTSMLYGFSFDGKNQAAIDQESYDSFDYDGQLDTHARNA